MTEATSSGAHPGEPSQSRREALRQGVAAAGALAAVGLLRPAAALAQSPNDEDLRDFLVEAIALEQNTVLAYATAADAAEGETKRTLTHFRDQEQAHANALLSAIDELGFDAPEAPNSATDTAVYDGVDGLADASVKRLTGQLDRLDAAKGLNQLLNLLAALENDQLTYYVSRGPALDSADLSTTAAEIAGCQAQHLVFFGERGRVLAPPALAIGQTAAEAARKAESG